MTSQGIQVPQTKPVEATRVPGHHLPRGEATHPNECVAWTLAFCSAPQLSSVGDIAAFEAPTRRSVGFF